MSRPDLELSWVADGQALFERAVMDLDGLTGQSRLSGWTRGHVVTHVARNAEGLSRLLTWARTGIETPMYPSAQAREAAIEAGAGRPQAEQLDDLRRSGAAFATAANEMLPAHWKAIVGTRHGTLPASQVPWARVRELWLHLVDLNCGAELDLIPEDIATMLVRDVAGWMHSRVPARVVMQMTNGEPVDFGPETSDPVPVSGPVQELAGWLTGRCSGNRLSAPDGLPVLPQWI